ncbi:uncharacterized protein LOC133832399 [Humulus lupulus]|uniref:uncharacterized protein LOC133832399 n=1 Tax=Humulus lupulus TaxID=3486 RepID=UPI002B40FEA2|nr:uncharacterized protein LOC133832399 [Humulus lupulus]
MIGRAVQNNKLKVSKLYNLLLHRDKVQYAFVIWCNLSVPKHRFILWQATLRHLLTRDNLLKCQLCLPSVLCPICELHQESHDHLFFQCKFSQLLRSKVAAWLGCAIWPVHLNDWVDWMVGKPKCLQQKLLATGLAAAVYFIWWNRYNCIFNLCSVSVNAVFALLQNCLKARLENLHRFKLKRKDVAFLEKVHFL